MLNKEKLRERFFRDPLPRRLGGLAATLGRILASARESSDPTTVARLLEEVKMTNHHLAQINGILDTPNPE